jgi:hypothetical protein
MGLSTYQVPAQLWTVPWWLPEGQSILLTTAWPVSIPTLLPESEPGEDASVSFWVTPGLSGSQRGRAVGQEVSCRGGIVLGLTHL